MTRLLLDPWAADYPTSLEAEDLDPRQTIDPFAESPTWAPLPPGIAPDRAWFIDGVRRLEARVVAWRGPQLLHGLFATFATGAVAIANGRATFTDATAYRRLLLSHGLSLTVPLPIGKAPLVYQGLATAATNPADLVLSLQTAMREAEAALAATYTNCITFLDGPLAYLSEPPGPVLGVIKSIHSLYLDSTRMETVFHLRPGERTPIFAITGGRKDRYSWYLRIAPATAIQHPLAGILRLEARAAAGLDAAIALANSSAAFLPRLASTPARDPRAPQNLTPVGALEEHLRNQMGSTTLIQRAIQQTISQGLTL